ncbi:MAG: circadian clock protein KaiC [Desulfamplus sp.]|nr:circadian clock protein KaiC [Desulfamplus sp.]
MLQETSYCIAEPPYSIEKISTGILGMDEVLSGGIPKRALTLLSGGPGTGKTIIGLEFLVKSAMSGNPCIMLTFEEREHVLRGYANSFGWNLQECETKGMLGLISARVQPHAIISGSFDLQGILAILNHKIKEIKADRIVIDAPDVFLRLLNNVNKERNELVILNEWLSNAGMTTIMTVKSASHLGNFGAHYEFLEYMADCVIHLDQRVVDQVATRRLRIVKYRGSGFGRNEYPFGMTDKGVWIIPITQTNLQHRALGESLPTGVKNMDSLLKGGYRRASCTLISGSSGSGKTTFICSFVVSIIKRGERLLYLNFEESWAALVSCMTSPGIDLESALKSGLMKYISAMPESQGIEEHLIQAFTAINEFNPKHIVVDAISACRRMGSSHAAFDYLLRLIDHCKQRGITTLLTNLTAANAADEITGIDLSSVIDTVIVLRNVERDGAYVREVGIIKCRGRSHSNLIHQFMITDSGIVVTEKEVVNVCY